MANNYQKRPYRYIVTHPSGAIVGFVSHSKKAWKCQEQADYRWGRGCLLTKTWMSVTVFRLWLKERGRCHLCGCNVPPTVGERDPRAPSADHILPRVAGGRRSPENLRLAHRFCNSRRNDRPVNDMAPSVYEALLGTAARGWPDPEPFATDAILHSDPV